MKCKKILLVSSLFAAMAVSNVANAGELDSTTVINFTGVFQETTCAVTLDDKSIESGSVQVDLKAYKPSKVTKDTPSTPVKFDVKFSTCGVIKNADITFTGKQSNTNLFDVTTEANKDSVAVGISTDDQNKTYLSNTDKVAVVFQENQTTTQSFYASYVKVGTGAIVSDRADATANMVIAYR